ncbi:MAG TPA: 3-hydroxyacyl-CoA dehydrogenase family protein [Parafilimonas sp.]|nr:3-hydroxyacyl-CoA dehydrogenase family protein [Parafilimonas sp.]
MNIAIRATEDQKKELIEKGYGKNALLQWIGPGNKLSGIYADAIFDLTFNDAKPATNEFIDDKPVFAHAVNCIGREINKPNYIRINAWNGFLRRPVIELVCSNDEYKKKAEEILQDLEWQFVWVADDYGFIAARVIAMIINEAYYALEEKVSTKTQIDIAMKLGTNYPYGPFEWSKKIGLRNILFLLQRLSGLSRRYTISGSLVQESQQF